MKLSWIAAISTAIVLRATPVLSQDTGEEEDYNVIPHIPEDCSDIRIFSARGSDEPYPGRGGAMLGIMCWLFESAGVSCDYEDVSYPANISWSGIFCESADIGAHAGRNQMTKYVQRCPDSHLVLMGYSQGASVVGDILGGGGGQLFGFVAAVTFGSPRFTADQPYNIGRGSSYNGVLPRWGKQLSDLNEYEDIIAMWCNAGDPVCAVGSEPVNITAHWSYYDEYANVASRWVVATAMSYTDKQLDLDLDGKNESVVLTESKPSGDNSGGHENTEEGLTEQENKHASEASFSSATETHALSIGTSPTLRHPK
ncbi:hypothetical protein DV736_g5984, partial [Chaetothyriales sp. CBS 134916]